MVKYKQIEHLIGLSHHSPSEGIYCESLLKEFLRRTLPRHVSVDSGFVRRVRDCDRTSETDNQPADADFVTPQLDIIIHDTHRFAPLLRSEDFVVVLPESVRAIIEVKKRLTANKLKLAVDTLARATNLLQRWRYDQNRLFTGIFAFSLGDDLHPKKKLISSSIQRIFQSTADKYSSDRELPYLTMALPQFALQATNRPGCFDYLQTRPEGTDVPNVASQFLVFLLSHFTSPGSPLIYPNDLRSRRQSAFQLSPPRRPGA